MMYRLHNCFSYLPLIFYTTFSVQSSHIDQRDAHAVTQSPTLKRDRRAAQNLFPNSELFEKWHPDLSEEEQRKAEELFQRYGYNVFLSDKIPLDRELPETRDHRSALVCAFLSI